VLATGHLQGTGAGPQVNFLPGTQSVVANAATNGLNHPFGVAVDGSGNIYIGDDWNNRVLKETLSADSYIQSVVANNANNGLYDPWGVAVDGGGNVYIADYYNQRVLKETPSAEGYTQSVVANYANNGLNSPEGVAVDGSGNVYIADYWNNRVLKETLSAGSYIQSVVANAPDNGLDETAGVAVDGSGNVYIADYYSNRVLKETPSAGSYSQTVIANSANNGLHYPYGVAVDGSGNIYIADSDNNRVLKETPSAGSYTQSVVANSAANGLNSPMAVAVEGSGNLYIADSFNSRVLIEDFADPPSLSFASTTIGETSSDSPQTVTVENIGNAALSFPIPSTGSNPSLAGDFILDSSGTTACPLLTSSSSSAGTLAPGASCELPISFAPTAAGALTGSLVLSDDNLNLTDATQTISLSGVGVRLAQTITFAALPNQTYGAAPFTLTATASSGLAVSFASTTSSICTVSVATVTLVAGGGTCTIEATQAGNADYAAAPMVTQDFSVFREAQTITFATPVDQTYGTPYTLTATASSGLAVSYTSTTTSICTVSGSTVTFVSGGAGCTIQASQAGNADYSAATTITHSFWVYREAQTISFMAPPPTPYSAATVNLSATASSGLAVTFTSKSTGVCTVSGATATLVSVGTCTISANQAGNGGYVAATAVTQSFVVTRAAQAISFATPLDQTFGTPLTLSATANSGLGVSYASTTLSVCTVSGSTVTFVSGGAGCTIQASQAGNSDYIPAPTITRSFWVYREAQTITFSALSAQTYGETPITVSATATSGLAVTFASTTPSICTVLGSTVTLGEAGTCTIKATQAGNNGYVAATAVSQSFTITQASQTITFATPADQTYGTPLTLSATASSGLAVSYTSTTSSVCMVYGSTVTFVSGGANCTIQASQAGNSDYSAAPVKTQSFWVYREAQTITFATIPSQKVSTALTLSATASSDLVVTFTSATTKVCTVSGTTATFVAAGTCTIKAAQAGNTGYLAATTVSQSFTVNAN
jgi:hypothetical protein